MQTTSPSPRVLFAALILSVCGLAFVACSGDANTAVPESGGEQSDAGDQFPGRSFDGGSRRGPATTGEGCDSDAECASGNCLQTAEFPGGYCSTTNCDEMGKSCTGEDAACVDNQEHPDLCLDGCSSDDDCRDGYACKSHPDAQTDVCVKEGTSPEDGYEVGGDDGAPNGSGCDAHTECEGGACVRSGGFTGGYCTSMGCTSGSCAGSSVCVANSSGPNMCMDACGGPSDCRSGYECVATSSASTKVCVPEGTDPDDGYDVEKPKDPGQGCSEDSDCSGSKCVDSQQFDGGYCTTVGCSPVGSSDGCNGEGGVCVSNGSGQNICLSKCSGAGDCRDGYACEPSSSAGGQTVCVPEGTNPDDGYNVGGPGAGDTGSSCSVASECKGGRCLDSSGFSDGYCTTAGCSPVGSSSGCAGGGVCVSNSKGPSLCLNKCSGDSDCRDGYSCESSTSAGGQRVCVPDGSDPDDGFDVGKDPGTGSTCDSNSDCGSGVCMQADGFDDGYCTEPDCDPNQSGSCTGDATCLDNSQGSNVCLENCSGEDSDCRSGYDCAETSDGSDVCVPEGTNPGGGYDVGDEWDGYTGDDCNSDSDCVEGTCVETKQFPDGYCSTLHCNSSSECSSEDAHCKSYRQGTDMCMRDCSNGCRNGYTCEGSACVPDGSTLNSGFEPTRYDLGFLCLPERTGWGSLGAEWTFKFQIDGDTSSYMFVPVVTSGTVKALELQTPSRRIDIANDYKHHNSKWGVDGAGGATYGGNYGAISYSWPVLVPYAPQYNGYVRSGGHTLEVTSSTERPCLYVVEKEQRQGSTIDLNVYAVSNSRSSSSLSNDSDWSTITNHAETLLETADISFGNIDYRSPSGAASNFDVPESYDELAKVAGVGERTSSDMDDYLTIDVVVVDNIQIDREGGTASPLGWVGNTPGAAGLHGNPRNGIVINSDQFGRANQAIGYILAHMLGHFLGLRHTTATLHNSGDAQEMSNKYGTTDPIQDTPVCSDIDERLNQEDLDNSGSGSDIGEIDPGDQMDGKDISGCPDYENLMFPAIPPKNADFTPSLTDDQEEVLEANPLVKP